ncbi:uncharacterized protein LOC119612001 [Lucilia sericata]|uniref:uncharacterized protein LOC119612001 n=1 Tax=Lucilia sericata TaxID=13632 RepID=UPI0018A818CA|nr:uncharacterized protein LOC119612001 [Lucilia sericata]
MCKYCLKNEYNSCSYKWRKIPLASWNLPLGEHENICYNIQQNSRKEDKNITTNKKNSRIERCRIDDLFEKARDGYLGEYLTTKLITKGTLDSRQLQKATIMEPFNTTKIPHKKTNKNRRKNLKNFRTVFKDFSIFYNNIVGVSNEEKMLDLNKPNLKQPIKTVPLTSEHQEDISNSNITLETLSSLHSDTVSMEIPRRVQSQYTVHYHQPFDPNKPETFNDNDRYLKLKEFNLTPKRTNRHETKTRVKSNVLKKRKSGKCWSNTARKSRRSRNISVAKK